MESSNPSWIASFDQESVDQQLAASLFLKAQIRDDVDGEMVEKSDEFQLGFINRSDEDEGEDKESEEAESESEESEEEFSFASVGSDSSTVSAAGGFQDGEIRTTFFPLFDQSLLYAVDRNDLPHRPSVKKVFIETEDSFSLNPPPPPSSLSSDSGPYCAWSRKAVEASSSSPQICKKSNSTGFCKLWRVQDLMKRSNSDGRDAYVFLNNGSSSSKKQVSSADGDAKTLALGRKVKKSSITKGKSAGMKAHEKYLRSKEEDKERRKTYLPYRPELMGFFTNIHGGLSRNVHPF